MKTPVTLTLVATGLLMVPALMMDFPKLERVVQHERLLQMRMQERARVRPFDLLPEGEKSRLRAEAGTLDDDQLYQYGMSHHFLNLMYAPLLDLGTYVDMDALIKDLERRALLSKDPLDREVNLALAKEVRNRKGKIARDWRMILNEKKRN